MCLLLVLVVTTCAAPKPGAMDDATEILNIISRFAWSIDTRDFAAIGILFRELTYTSCDARDEHEANPASRLKYAGAEELMSFYERGVTASNAAWVRRRALSSNPEEIRTRHVFTNIVLEVDAEAGKGSASYYGTVYSFADGLPLSIRYAGRYYDAFEKRDGAWLIVGRHHVHDYREPDPTAEVVKR